MEKHEIFSMFQRIEEKLDKISQQHQERCDFISAEQRKQIDSKVSTSIFKWVTSFIIGGMVSLALFAADTNTKVSVMYAKYKNIKTQEAKVGDAYGVSDVGSDPCRGENP